MVSALIKVADFGVYQTVTKNKFVLWFSKEIVHD